jgi:hypothetical protein
VAKTFDVHCRSATGLGLHPTDADVALGQGQRVEGPAVSLLVAAAGRRAAYPT